MWSSHKVRPTRAAPGDSFRKSAPQSLSDTLYHKFLNSVSLIFFFFLIFYLSFHCYPSEWVICLWRNKFVNNHYWQLDYLGWCCKDVNPWGKTHFVFSTGPSSGLERNIVFKATEITSYRWLATWKCCGDRPFFWLLVVKPMMQWPDVQMPTIGLPKHSQS